MEHTSPRPLDDEPVPAAAARLTKIESRKINKTMQEPDSSRWRRCQSIDARVMTLMRVSASRVY